MSTQSHVRPRLFVASSVEARPAAEAIAGALEEWYETKVWTDDFFQPGVSTVDSITTRIREFDGGVFLLTPDDLLYSRRKVSWLTRANVLFEIGLFGGVLGVNNCIQVVLKGAPDPCAAFRLLGTGAWPVDNCQKFPDAGAVSRDSSAVDGGGGDDRSIGHPSNGCRPADTAAPQLKDQTASVPDGGPPPSRRGDNHKVDPITDLQGITWIEARCSRKLEGSRVEFTLEEPDRLAVMEYFRRRHQRDAVSLAALRGAGPLEVLWSADGADNIASVQLAAFGNRVRLHYRWPEANRSYECSVQFVSSDKLEGTWWDCQDRGYSGSAAFQVRHTPPQLVGRWTGWSENGGVRSGDFLVRPQQARQRADLDRFLIRATHKLRTAVVRRLR